VLNIIEGYALKLTYTVHGRLRIGSNVFLLPMSGWFTYRSAG